MMRHRRRVLVAGALALLATVGPARAAGADPARPGNVSSEVTGITPAAPLTAAVKGGDSFLEVRVERGHEVVVQDYEAHPYVRFATDGTVYVNRQSKATYQNETRSASSSGPATIDPGGPPDWKQVASGGTYAWHDHRVHWMSPTRAETVNWKIPLTVDGRPVEIDGVYGPVDAPAAWPWWLVVVVVAAAVGFAARRHHRVGAAAVVLAGALATPVVVGLVRLPASSWVLGSLVAAALLAGLVAVLLRGSTGAALAAGGAVAIGLWGLRRTDVFGHAVLVTSLPAALDRLSVALAVGVGLGVLGATVWAFTRPPVATPGATPAPV